MSLKALNTALDQILDQLRMHFIVLGNNGKTWNADRPEIPGNIISALLALFSEKTALAFQLIEQEKISLIRGADEREVYQVMSSDGQAYHVFKNAFFCTCPTFKHRVIGTGSELMCKHILGTRIADAMGILSPRYADAQTLKDIFSSKVDLKDPQLESEVSSKSFAISRMLDDSIEEHLEPVDTEDLENLAPMSSLSD